jgi:hypothetical protein
MQEVEIEMRRFIDAFEQCIGTRVSPMQCRDIASCQRFIKQIQEVKEEGKGKVRLRIEGARLLTSENVQIGYAESILVKECVQEVLKVSNR